MTALEQAKKNLADYIDSLPPDQREKAIAYQKGLDDEAAKTEGGMKAVILKRVKHLELTLVEAVDEFNEHAAGVIAEAELKKISKL